jgi:hypothetical protein
MVVEAISAGNRLDATGVAANGIAGAASGCQKRLIGRF